MSNYNRDVFWSIVGRKKAGADVTKTIAAIEGRRGNPISWNTIDRWVTAGLLRRKGRRLILTAAGVRSKSEQV